MPDTENGYREWDKELGSGWERTLWLLLGRMELHLKSLLLIDKTGKVRNLINVWDFCEGSLTSAVQCWLKMCLCCEIFA